MLPIFQKHLDFCGKYEMMLAFKEKIHEACEKYLSERMSSAFTAMEAAQESANSDEKSSAGDKFETGRAMGQLDRDMFARQFVQAKSDFDKLKKVRNSHRMDHVGLGSLIKTERSWFYIAVGLGNLNIDEKIITVISEAAPVMKEMNGKKAGESYSVNQNTFVIEEVW